MRRARVPAGLLVVAMVLVCLAGGAVHASPATLVPLTATTGTCAPLRAAPPPPAGRIVTVPKTTGLELDAAFRVLHRAGLRVSTDGPTRLGPTTGLPPVWQQRPRPGTRVRAGDVVRIRQGWSLGGVILPTFDEVVAPAVAGLTLREALERLADSRVVWHVMVPRVRRVYADSVLDAFCVDEQTPAAGSRFVQTIAREGPSGGISFRWRNLKLHVTLR